MTALWLAILVLCGLSLLLLIVVLPAMISSCNRLPVLRPGEGEPPEGIVSVIVPAYDEAPIIRATVSALLDSTPREQLEVIVVDDGSTDETLSVLRRLARERADPRLKILAGQPRPAEPVIIGKNWACAQGARAATGRYLLFVDADFSMKPGGIEAALEALCRREAGLLGLFAEKALRIPSEWLVEPQLTILHLISPWVTQTPDPEAEKAFTPGWFMLWTREAYERVGGHMAVADVVLEDLALGALAKRERIPVLFCLGPDVGRLQLYDSFAELREGYVKNFFCGVEHDVGMLAASTLFGFLLFPAPWLGAIGCLASAGPGLASPLWAAATGVCVGALGVQLLLRLVLRRHLRVPLRYLWGIGVGGLIINYLGVASLIRHKRGQITWKGRPIPNA